MNKTIKQAVYARSMNPNAPYSGEWARVTGVEIRRVDHRSVRLCYLVEFPDGATGSWDVQGNDAQYEFRTEFFTFGGV